MNEKKRRQADTYIRAVRMELYGTPTAPYRDAETAIQAIKDESAEGQTGDYGERVAFIKSCFVALRDRMEADKEGFPIGIGLTVGIKQAHVAYPGIDRWTRRVLASTIRLRRLSEVAQYLADYVGCLTPSATMSILTDAPLPAKTLTTQLTIRGNPVGTTSENGIQANSEEHISAWQMQDAWKQLTPQLSPRDIAFCELLDEMREEGIEPPPPPGKRGVDVGQRNFWVAFLARWQARYHRQDWEEWQLNHWDSARKRWLVLQARI